MQSGVKNTNSDLNCRKCLSRLRKALFHGHKISKSELMIDRAKNDDIPHPAKHTLDPITVKVEHERELIEPTAGSVSQALENPHKQELRFK
ncbi:hypothetical protein Tco_0752827 [Tanacetum coccineum]|uniref:Uncharacterized protein n=1 Tax=Tanacetum coccineum TaxID=301880 RepID=A0ABQ4Z977_9ASTR